MGYTNYWKQATDFTDDQWSKVKMEADYVRSWSLLDQIKKYCEVSISKDTIEIYGSCETFVLNKKARTKPRYDDDNMSYYNDLQALHFCKTREQVYDLAVWHLLTACAFIKPDFKISRDNHNFTETIEPKAVVNG